jgi:hypothetical protein
MVLAIDHNHNLIDRGVPLEQGKGPRQHAGIGEPAVLLGNIAAHPGAAPGSDDERGNARLRDGGGR